MNIEKIKNDLVKEYNELVSATAEANKKLLVLQGKIEQIVEIEQLLEENKKDKTEA